MITGAAARGAAVEFEERGGESPGAPEVMVGRRAAVEPMSP